jgi:light-regulated signal transduction histidine kinase (bacteriophytochrome)
MTLETEQPGTSIDLTSCDREPIHVPGAILPHGAMLVLDAATLRIVQAAGATERLLGVPVATLLGRHAADLLQPHQVQNLMALNGNFDLERPRHLLDPVLRVLPELPADASLHRTGGCLVLEFEAADATDGLAADPLASVQEMVRGFDDAVSVLALCHLAADKVRDVARYDRVLIYRFMPDESGWVVAESREPQMQPFLDLHYPAADIPRQARALYVKNWLRLITQVDYDPAPLTPATNALTGQPLDMSHAVLRDVSPVHRQYLRNMGINASMSISIIRGGRLWGLIACHHYSPRPLPRHLRAMCELFGSMLSLQLDVREKSDHFTERLASRMVLQNLMLNLASADDYATGLTQQSPNLLDYIHCGDPAADGTRHGGVAVSVKDQLTFLGVTPDEPSIALLVEWLNTVMPQYEGVFATDRLGELWPPARDFATVASGILVIAVSHEPSDFIIWFRPELVATVTWAGEPGKHAFAGDTLNPRMSFERWKETVRGRCPAWLPADLEAASDLRISLLHVVLRRINTAARERKQAAARDRLLMAELDHRVKNTIANIQALVVHTSRSAESLTGFVQGLDGRIQSMAKAHSLLSQSRWEGVSVDKMMHEELDAYANGHRAIHLTGPHMLLTPKSALSLSLAVHELATNAAKFGSLSTPDGRVSVTWRLSADRGIELSWAETGGPLVNRPNRRGFGSTLIERALAMETGGTASIHYLRTGVVCDIFLPPSSVAAAGADAPAVSVVPPPPADRVPASVAPTFRILVVEDSFMLLQSLEMMFDDMGWEIVGPATRKADALTFAAEAEFDVALLDVNLDGEMSWDVAALLRQRGIPFVFSTGYDVSALLPPHLAGSAVIGKPFRIPEAEKLLRQVIAENPARPPIPTGATPG